MKKKPNQTIKPTTEELCFIYLERNRIEEASEDGGMHAVKVRPKRRQELCEQYCLWGLQGV